MSHCPDKTRHIVDYVGAVGSRRLYIHILSHEAHDGFAPRAGCGTNMDFGQADFRMDDVERQQVRLSERDQPPTVGLQGPTWKLDTRGDGWRVAGGRAHRGG